MTFPDQNIPIMHRLTVPDCFSCPTVDDLDPVRSPTECVCASIDGILHHLNEVVVGRRLPDEFLMSGILPNHRDFNPCISSPKKQLTRTPKFAELAEHQFDRFSDTLIWIDLDLIEIIPTVARRKREA